MKKITLLLMAAMLVLGLTACSKKTETETKAEADNADAKSTEEEALAIPAPEEAWEVIATPYGDLRYPANLYEDLKREEQGTQKQQHISLSQGRCFLHTQKVHLPLHLLLKAS